MGSARDVFHSRVKIIFQKWTEEIIKVLEESGLEPQLARERSEDVAIAIQGALILTHALDDTSIFQRIVKQLPQRICGD